MTEIAPENRPLEKNHHFYSAISLIS